MLYDFHCVNYIWSWESLINTYPSYSMFVTHVLHFTKDTISSFAILWIFYDVVHISLSFIWTCLLTSVSGYNIYGLWIYSQNCYGRRKTRSQLHLRQDMTPFRGENRLEHGAKRASARAGSWETKPCQHAAGMSLEHPSCHGQSQGDTTVPPTEGSETLS